jgi:hypothetical protein
MRNSIKLIFCLMAILVGGPALAVTQDDAIAVARSYMKTINGVYGGGAAPSSSLVELGRVLHSKSAKPEPTYVIPFGVTFDSPYEDGCSLVVLVSERTGEILPSAVVPEFSPYPEHNKLSTDKAWRCWLGNEHPGG